MRSLQRPPIPPDATNDQVRAAYMERDAPTYEYDSAHDCGVIRFANGAEAFLQGDEAHTLYMELDTHGWDWQSRCRILDPYSAVADFPTHIKGSE